MQIFTCSHAQEMLLAAVSAEAEKGEQSRSNKELPRLLIFWLFSSRLLPLLGQDDYFRVQLTAIGW